MADKYPIKDFEDFTRRAVGFDYYYAMSDDHRVYVSGRNEEERLKKYVAENKNAAALWKTLNRAQSLAHMDSQLIQRVNNVLFGADRDVAVHELESYCIGYHASYGKDTMTGEAIRDAIAKHIGAPSRWVRPRERQAMIDEYIDSFESPPASDHPPSTNGS